LIKKFPSVWEKILENRGEIFLTHTVDHQCLYSSNTPWRRVVCLSQGHKNTLQDSWSY